MFAALLGPSEILLLAAVALLLFGRRLPGLARSLGQTLVDFKKEIGGAEDDRPAG